MSKGKSRTKYPNNLFRHDVGILGMRELENKRAVPKRHKRSKKKHAPENQRPWIRFSRVKNVGEE